jgi:hypothetical protein
MAAYHKVEVSLNTNAVEVGIPSPQTVNVVVPTIGPAGPAGATGATGAVGAVGPQGPAGTGIETLTTAGDLLTRNSTQAIRLGIGTIGQVLKVSSQGLPHWAAEEGGVSSWNDLTDKPATFAPSTHASSHLASTPAVAASYTGTGDNESFSEEVTITANTAGTAGNSITLTFDGVDDVDTVLAAWNSANPLNQASLDSGDGAQVPDDGDSLQLSGGAAAIGAGSDPIYDQDLNTTDEPTFNKLTLTPDQNDSSLKLGTLEFQGYALNNAWIGDNVYFDGSGFKRRANGASTLFYFQGEEGQFRSDVSDNAGTNVTSSPNFKVGAGGKFAAGPSLSNVGSFTNAAIWCDGTNAGFSDTTDYTKKVKLDVSGVTAGQTRSLQIPNASGTLALTSDNADQFGSGAAADGYVLTADGAGGAAWEAATGGGGGDTVSIESTAADILSVSSGAISADDAGADRIVYWNNTSNKLTYGTPSDVGAAASSHTHSDATQSVAGFLSTADKTKLDGIASGANNYTHPNHSGDVTSAGDGATTIANNAVTNAKLAQVATSTLKGRATAGTGNAEDLTASQVRTLINVADGATANASDAQLRDRATHTGTQAATTITGLATVATTGAYGDLSGRPTLGTAAAAATTDFAAASHTHAASDITSGTLLHERGGLEADVSAYNGLVKIASGSTSAVTVTTAGEALLDDADAAAQRVTMGAAASGSITASGLTQATARILGRTTASTGAVEEITIGSGLSLSAGELSATGSGITAVGASTADVLSVSGSDLVADDPNADRIVFWDDSEGKWRYLEAGSGLSLSGTTLTATATGTIGGSTGATSGAVLRASGTGGSTLQASGLVIEDTVTAFTTVTGDAGTDIITATGSAFANGQRVRFTALTGGSGLNTTTNYFVIGVSGATFQLSTTEGGSFVNFTTNITAGTLLTGHAVQEHVQISNAASDTNSALVLTPKGTGAFVLGPPANGATSGGNARGSRAVDLQWETRFAATMVASGTGSVIGGGKNNTASETYSCVPGGEDNTASGSRSFAAGNVCAASGIRSTSIGWRNTTSGSYGAISLGGFSISDRQGMLAFASGRPWANNAGYAQNIVHVLWGKTTTNAAVELLAGDYGEGTVRLTVPSGRLFTGTLKIVGAKSDGSAVASYMRQVTIKNVAGTTSLVGTVNTIGTDEAASTSISITANDTNDAIKVECTGITSETWRWVCVANMAEMTYGS